MIVRPGRLVGGPYTNTDVSALFKVRLQCLSTGFGQNSVRLVLLAFPHPKVEEGSRKRVVIEKGDTLLGDAARISVAELVVRVSDDVAPAAVLVHDPWRCCSKGKTL